MRWPVFLRGVAAAMRAELPLELRAFEWSSTSWMAKAWYGNRAVHYEIWIRHRAKVVELGLHFEADELSNARLLGAFRMRAKEVRRALGDPARIEEWDKGWARIWEPFALRTLDEDFAAQVRGRFIDYVRVLEPMLREELPADLPWKARATSSRASRSARR